MQPKTITLTRLPNAQMLNIWLNLYEENQKSGNVMQQAMDSCVCGINTSFESILIKSHFTRNVNLTKWENFLTSNLYHKRRNTDCLLHDIPRFFILFLEELFLIFNQMLSIPAFGRRDSCILNWSKPFDTMIVFLKQFFYKVNFENKQQMTTKAWKKVWIVFLFEFQNV